MLPSQVKAEYDVSLHLPHLKNVAVKLTLTCMDDVGGDKQGSIVVMKDVSNERKLTSELEYRANYDSLTGTFNRFHFEKRLHSLLESTASGDCRHALCFSIWIISRSSMTPAVMRRETFCCAK